MTKKKNKFTHRDYTEDNLKEAQSKVRSGRLTPGKAAKLYGIPKTTLQRYKKNQQLGFSKRGRKFIMVEEDESTLARYIMWMADHNCPITYEILSGLAGQIMQARNPTLPSSLSHSWCRIFLKRHKLSARKARTTERARIAAASSFDQIKRYFDILKSEIDKLDLADKPEQIFNMDEVGWSKQQALQQPVIVPKGKPQATAQEVFSNTHITSVHTISASGKYHPPHIVFSKNLPSNLEEHLIPSNWTFSSSTSGYMDGNLFSQWFLNNFLKNIGRQRPVILIVDAASSHHKLEVLEKAVEENISIITLPGKTTGFLQPVDQLVSVLKHQFASQAYKCSLVKSSFLARPAQFPALLKCSLSAAWSQQLVQNSFKRTGIYPFDIAAIDREKLLFGCRKLFDAYINGEDTSIEIIEPDRLDANTSIASNEGDPSENSITNADTTENTVQCVECGSNSPCKTCYETYKMLHHPLLKSGIIDQDLLDILPVPSLPRKDGEKEKRPNNRFSGAELLTGDEIIKIIKEKQALREDKERKKAAKRTSKETQNSIASEETVLEEDFTDVNDETFFPHIPAPKRMRKKKTNEDTISNTNEHSTGSPSDGNNENIPENTHINDDPPPAVPSTSSRRSGRTRRVNYRDLNEGLSVENDINNRPQYKCPKCKIYYEQSDDMTGVLWYGCDVCPKWWHRHCLTTEHQAMADLSTMDTSVVFRCPDCPVEKMCCVCFISGTNDLDFAKCANCSNFYHLECLPEEHFIEFKVYRDANKDWFCSRCLVED